MPIYLAPSFKYHIPHAPQIFWFFWLAGGAAVIVTWVLAVLHMQRHLRFANTVDPIFLPAESRKVLVIIFMAPICALIQYTTLFSPRSGLVNQVLATVVQSAASFTFVELLMHLLGGSRTAVVLLGRLRARWWAWLVPPCCRCCGLRPFCRESYFSVRHFRICYYLAIQNAFLGPLVSLLSLTAERNDEGLGDCIEEPISTSEAITFVNAASSIAAILSLQTLRRAANCLLEPPAEADADVDSTAGRWTPPLAAAEGYDELAEWHGFGVNRKFLAMKATVLVSGLTASICTGVVQSGYLEPRVPECGGCPCYDRPVMVQMWTAFATVVVLVPLSMLLIRAYPVEPAVARARDVVSLALLMCERG